MGAGDSEVTRELDLGGILDSSVEVLRDAVSTDVGEEIRRLDRVIPGARLSEVVRSGD